MASIGMSDLGDRKQGAEHEPLMPRRGSVRVPRQETAGKCEAIKILFVGDEGDRPWTNVLLILAPFALFLSADSIGSGAKFGLCLVSLIPMAERLGFCTECIGDHTSESFAGLMNATMGNAPELIIAIFALKDNLIGVVQLSLLGSILSNLLLVLGTSFLLGGYKHAEQRYNNLVSSTSAGLLIMATACVLLPSVLSTSDTELKPGAALTFSRVSALIMFVLYVGFITFQLCTHKHHFDDLPDDALLAGDAEAPAAAPSQPKALPGEALSPHEGPALSLWTAMFAMMCIAVVIALLSQGLTDSIEGAAEDWGVAGGFVSTILVPIAGNAAEHACAIMFAYQNRLDISIGVAVGSSMQIALFLIPTLIIIGWMWGKPLSLDFHPFESATLLMTVLLASFVIQTGKSQWMMGALLIGCYGVVAAGFALHASSLEN